MLLIEGMKTCIRCKECRYPSEFHKNNQNKDGLSSHCKDCNNKKQRDRYKNNEKYRKKILKSQKEYRNNNKSHVRKTEMKSKYKCMYGITVEEREKVYTNQNGRCAICDISVDFNKIHTDHNHISNKFRGLLCSNCNLSLGLLKVDERDIELLTNAISYLRRQ